MGPERLYTLRELADVTSRSTDFWDRQCRSGRISYVQPDTAATRLISESAYDEWFLSSTGATEPEAPRRPMVATKQAWIDFEA